MSKVVKYAPEWYALEEKLLQSFREAVATGDYRWEGVITPNVKLESMYYSNGNRRVYLIVFENQVEIYSEYDKEGMGVVEARLLYAHKKIAWEKFLELQTLFGK